jgi:hypothetical protein
MRPGEWFSGEVIDRDSGAGLTYSFVSYKDMTDRLNLQQIATDLELRNFRTVGPNGRVSTFDAVVEVLLSNAPDARRPNQQAPQEIRDFAEYLISEPVVPIRTNPLRLEKLATIVTGAGVGAGIGFALGGPTPLLIVTLPAGVIIGSAAAGVGYGLRDGLHYKIRKWFGVPDDWKPPN